MDRDDGRFVTELLDRARGQVGDSARTLIGPTVRAFRLHGLRHWLSRERDAFVQTAKAAVAAAIAWEIAGTVFHLYDPVLASVAALVVVQVTVYQSVRRAIQYSAGIVAGMTAALLIGTYVGINMLTLCLIVVLSLMVGRTLRLGTQVNQVAITGLLVLALGSHYGKWRIVDSVIGAAIGVVVNMLVAPPSFTRTAAKEIADLADDLAGLCTRCAKGLRADGAERNPAEPAAQAAAAAEEERDEQWRHTQAQDWLARSRSLARAARSTRQVAQQAEESIRYHPRKSTHQAGVHQVDEAAIALDHVATQLNSVMRGLTDLRGGSSGIPAEHRRVPEELILLLDDAARALNAYGRLQLPDRASPRVYEELSQLIAGSKPHARDAAEALHPDEDDPTMLWSIHGALLDDTRRMLRELDPDNGPHREGIPAAIRSYMVHPSR
ncbi:MAG TPA: aromatic acid exporter family protein [Actinocrinis sp.]|nr:aromatic acid exporter family protein [Actinocrinis sp.]